jgi:hypothetical protein
VARLTWKYLILSDPPAVNLKGRSMNLFGKSSNTGAALLPSIADLCMVAVVMLWIWIVTTHIIVAVLDQGHISLFTEAVHKRLTWRR